MGRSFSVGALKRSVDRHIYHHHQLQGRGREVSDSLRPQPVPHVPVGTEAEVCADIAHRQKLGIAKYGTTVADNPLPLEAWLQHAYEETLDKAIYLKRAIAELKKQQTARAATPA